ncbi:phage holin family protein [Paenibacillus glycinis]|uniref:Holin n=1 Tax=Paenibacillus glycinis TaxID=2697035 RepID=A0ABW9XNU4_9BACL|nr:phage holin family protein [Paenibacillus glycinis]NBD24310.1 holin [Paenibacillus glycinis]
MNQFKEFMLIVTSTAVGGGKGTIWGSAAASVGVCITSWLGGWDKALQVLLVLMLADYVTGVLGAIRLKKLNSEVMYWGGIRKMVCLFVIGLASLLDDWLQPGVPIFRTTAIYFYGGREGLSIIENLGVIGVPLPQAIRDLLEQLGEKGEGTDAGQTTGQPKNH